MKLHALRVAVATVLLAAGPIAHAESERQSLEELRNTVINLLQALVDQGVMSREKAEQLVKQAQEKAAAEAVANAKQDEGAVRVVASHVVEFVAHWHPSPVAFGRRGPSPCTNALASLTRQRSP